MAEKAWVGSHLYKISSRDLGTHSLTNDMIPTNGDAGSHVEQAYVDNSVWRSVST